jgi:hypothetical protein
MHWHLPLSYAQLMRKCAFILAILSGRRLSELFNLKCDVSHLQISNNFVQLVPTFLSKTDKAGRIGPPIFLKSWREDESYLPSGSHPHPLGSKRRPRHSTQPSILQRPSSVLHGDSQNFQRIITRSLRDAGIDAQLGSTCATAASSALGRGLAMGYILRMGNWSASSTFLRHYADL